jgi:hypothetical protein
LGDRLPNSGDGRVLSSGFYAHCTTEHAFAHEHPWDGLPESLDADDLKDLFDQVHEGGEASRNRLSNRRSSRQQYRIASGSPPDAL